MDAARHYRELIAWQLADSFKKEVIALVAASSGATRDFRYKGQLHDAACSIASNIAEGFVRYHDPDFARFLSYALGSLAEAEQRLADGVDLRYFTKDDCQVALRYGKRCFVATIRLRQSLEISKTQGR